MCPAERMQSRSCQRASALKIDHNIVSPYLGVLSLYAVKLALGLGRRNAIRKEFFETPDMVCELCGHRRGSLLPFAPQRGWRHGDVQRLMRADEIEDRILKGEMALQEIALLRMRQSFTHQTPDTLARGEIVTLDIRRVDLLAPKHLGDDVARTEDDASADLDHASLLAPFIYLSIE